MPKQTFIAFYIATFLATYDALNYDMNRMAEKPVEQFYRPIEDAATLAAAAWEKVQEFSKGPSPAPESPAKVA